MSEQLIPLAYMPGGDGRAVDTAVSVAVYLIKRKQSSLNNDRRTTVANGSIIRS